MIEEVREGAFQVGGKNPVTLKASAEVFCCRTCLTMLADWRMEEARTRAFSEYLKTKIFADEIPEPYRTAHAYASRHRLQLEHSNIVACFYCLARSTYSDITRWIDNGETAMCPKCGIDSVLPVNEKIDDVFLKGMQHYWFECPLKDRLPSSSMVH